MASFIQWLHNQADRDDPIGDLARDTQRDPWFRSNTDPSFRNIRQHLSAQAASTAAHDALVAAHREWRKL